MKHPHDKFRNPDRFKILRNSQRNATYWRNNGLNNLNYTVVDVNDTEPHVTRLLVDLMPPARIMAIRNQKPEPKPTPKHPGKMSGPK